MKITSQEEYGLRILLRIGACRDKEGMNIPQLSEAEGLTQHYVAKLARVLRMGGFINSTPGYKGGYVLAKPAKEIIINDVLKVLGGVVFDKAFCSAHTGSVKICTNSVDCSARSLWQMVQFVLNRLLDRITLYDLINPETESVKIMTELLYEPLRPAEV